MILTDHIPAVCQLLQTAAVAGCTVSFPQLFRLFPEGTERGDIYRTLEAASLELADSSVAIYSALMAKSQTGMPGDGFFDIFRNCHRDEYLRIAGDVQPNGLTNKQQLEMVLIERVTVYAHAKT